MDVYLLSFVFAVAILGSAAVSDIRCREVDDRYWFLILAVSVPCLVASGFIEGRGADVLIPVVASTLFMGAAVSEGRASIALFVFGVVAWVAALFNWNSSLAPLYVVPVFEFLIIMMYVSGMVRGGADVKCLLVIAVCFPMYRSGGGELLGLVFPPVVSVLFLAVLMTFVCGSVWILWLCRYGSVWEFPRVRMPIDAAGRSFVWLAEDVVDGSVRRKNVPDVDKNNALVRLHDIGAKDVLVNPMLPFIVPLAFSFLVVALLGNPFLILRS